MALCVANLHLRYAFLKHAPNLYRPYYCCLRAFYSQELSTSSNGLTVHVSLPAVIPQSRKDRPLPTASSQGEWRRARVNLAKRVTAMSSLAHGAEHSSQQVASSLPFLRTLLDAILTPYLVRNPTAESALDLIRQHERGPVHYDHFAFRTFGADGCGISSLSEIFCEFGYTQKDELLFPAKKLKAYWFAPPDEPADVSAGDGVNGPLPRVFISELQVEHLSEEAQNTIRKYTSAGGQLAKHAALASVLGALPWLTPSLEDYQRLASESEYAAWTLVNGYALNHTTVAVHHLRSDLGNINGLNAFLQENGGLRLNAEGSILKVSPDGGLLQSSTVADSRVFRFADGREAPTPASYIEFAERLVLPEFAHLPQSQIKEHHRREGFEVGNADKIFESTYRGALSAK